MKMDKISKHSFFLLQFPSQKKTNLPTKMSHDNRAFAGTGKQPDETVSLHLSKLV